MNDFAKLCYLVRLERGRRKAEIYRIRHAQPRALWRFNHGVTVIDCSLSDALKSAFQTLGVDP